MDIKVLLACLLVEASALCPIGYKYDIIHDKCQETCPDCHERLLKTRRQLTNLINPSRADLGLIADKLKYAVKSFVDSEGMIDTYLCPSAWSYDFSKKRCMPPPKRNRRYLELAPVQCPYCNLKEDQKKREPKVIEAVDLFAVPLYAARSKKRNRNILADIIDQVMKVYDD